MGRFEIEDIYHFTEADGKDIRVATDFLFPFFLSFSLKSNNVYDMSVSLFLAIKIESPLFTSYWQSVTHALTKERRDKQNQVMVIILIVFFSNYTWPFFPFSFYFLCFFFCPLKLTIPRLHTICSLPLNYKINPVFFIEFFHINTRRIKRRNT